MTNTELLLPPQNLEAERAVIGACLMSKEALASALEILTPDDFYDLKYGDVFRHMQAIVSSGGSVDWLILSDRIKNTSPALWDQLGGQSFLASIMDLPTAANVEHYARIVQDKALRRRMINAGNSVTRMAYEEQNEVNDVMEQAERLVFDVSRKRNDVTFHPVGEALPEIIQDIQTAIDDKSHGLTGITTGFIGIDKVTNGLQRGSLYIIAARPSMGKTALALNIAYNVASIAQLPVLVFSLEMSSKQLTNRLLASEARVSTQDMKTGYVTDDDCRSISDAAQRISKVTIVTDESSILTPIELKARARRFKAKHNDIGLIVVDYLQLMSASRKLDNRQNEVAEISRGLKAVARELDVPVLALSQLSRGVESRNDKQPQLSDLRDSGAIEQDADLVGLLYRNSYYAKDELSKSDNTATLNIAKNRNGPTDAVQLVFLKEYTRFEDRSIM